MLASSLTAAAIVLVAGPVSTASAADDSNWWFTKYNLSAAHSAGVTGSGVKVAVVDGAINPDLAVFQGRDLKVHEPSVCGAPAATAEATAESVHGSDVTAMLIGNGTGPGAVQGVAPGVELNFYADASTSSTGTSNNTCTKDIDGRKYSSIGLAIRQAVADGNDIVSVSQTTNEQYAGDLYAITQALARGIVIVAANENELGGVAQRYPQLANGVVSVNAFKQDGSLQTQADGATVAFDYTTVVAAGWGFSSQAAVKPALAWGDNAVRLAGSSLATPLVSGMLALVAQKYPKATGNQLIQSLIHNTGSDDHELTRFDGGYGYGAASATHMLRVDPAQYPDENPLMNEPQHQPYPTADQVAKEKAAPTGDGTAGGSAAPRPSGFSAIGAGLVAAGVVGGLVVVAGVVVLIVLLSRRRNGVSRGGTR
jgi:hypothetical protein